MEIRDLTELNVWRESRLLLITVFKTIEEMPKSESNGEASNLRKYCVAIPANIMRAFCYKEKEKRIRFVHISVDSAKKLMNSIHRACNLRLLSTSDYQTLLENTTDIMNMLVAYTDSLDSSN